MLSSKLKLQRGLTVRNRSRKETPHEYLRKQEPELNFSDFKAEEVKYA